jgi:hypothetical protein
VKVENAPYTLTGVKTESIILGTVEAVTTAVVHESITVRVNEFTPVKEVN